MNPRLPFPFILTGLLLLAGTGCLQLGEAETELCNDGLDQDGDGQVDCADPDCAQDPECADGLDDDSDDDDASPDDDDASPGDDDSAPDDDDTQTDDDDTIPGDDDDSSPPFKWFFSVHVTEVDYDLTTSDQAFDEILALGGTGVRTDVFWYDVEPSEDQWDESMLQFYDDYFSLALDRGIEPMIILSNAPQWAKNLYTFDPAAFWIRYETYVQRVVTLLADRTDHWQLWNEPNHLIDPISAGDDWQLFTRAGSTLRALDPTATLYVNAMANLVGWEDDVTDWVTLAGDFIDVIGVDHYAGTWSAVPFDDWGPVETLAQRINDPADAWYGKGGAVMEAGYSSWAGLGVADEEDQQAWIQQAMPALFTLIQTTNKQQEHGIWLGNYYQLLDVDTDGLGQEAHFGILHSDFSWKVGAPDLAAEIATFGSL